MADVLGLIGDSLGIYSFFSSLFASKQANICIVRVSAALNSGSLSGADGTVDSVRLYNENQQLIGNKGSSHISSGGFHDFAVSQPSSQQAAYAEIAASTDAICIPYATTTWVDGSHYDWSGDWGYECGLEWYYGNVFVSSASEPHWRRSTC